MVKHSQTAPEDDLIRLYLDDIGKHELLSRADEVMLGEARLVVSFGQGEAENRGRSATGHL